VQKARYYSSALLGPVERVSAEGSLAFLPGLVEVHDYSRRPSPTRPMARFTRSAAICQSSGGGSVVCESARRV
jgi:hypothetical protein